MRRDTGNAYERAVARVVAHLQQVVRDNAALPDLVELAAVAHLSPFHFHRIYRALTGETTGRTVARLRMLRALRRLAESAAPMTQVALEAGFSTPQALARALRGAVGASASELRASPDMLRAAQRSLVIAPGPAAGACAPLQVRIETRVPVEVVTLRRRGAFEDLDAGFAALMGWAVEAGVAEQLDCLAGIPLGDHRDLPAQAFLFDCAMGFTAAVDPPPPFVRQALGPGLYAVLRHTGPYGQLEDAFDQLLACWLPRSGHALRDAPVFYLFLDDPEQVPAAILRADLCVPLQPV